MSNGKGDTPRPPSVSGDECRRNWDAIFEAAALPTYCRVCGARLRGGLIARDTDDPSLCIECAFDEALAG